jgi:hypothetical protein
LTYTITINETSTDITSYVVPETLSLDYILHDGLEHKDSTCSVKVANLPKALLTSMLFDKTYKVNVSILDDLGDAFFTGILSPTYEISDTKRFLETITLKIEDYSITYLKQNIDTSFLKIGYQVCNPSSTNTSLIHYLTGLAGVTLSDSLPTISNVIPVYKVISTDDLQFADEIQNLIQEFGYVYYFTRDGKFNLYKIESPSDTSTITNQLINSTTQTSNIKTLKMNKKREDYDKVKLKWYEVTLEEDITLFEDTTDGDDDNDCNIELDSGEWYPSDSDDTVDTDYYSDYSYDGLLGATTATLNAEYDSGIAISKAFKNYGTKGYFQLLSSKANQYITKLNITGNGYVKSATHYSILKVDTDSKNQTEIDCDYIFSETDANAYGTLLINYYNYSDYVFTVGSTAEFALGAFVKIIDELHFDKTLYGRIKEIKYENKNNYYTYLIEGIKEAIDTVSETSATSSGDSTQDKIDNITTTVSAISGTEQPSDTDLFSYYSIDDSCYKTGFMFDNSGNQNSGKSYNMTISSGISGKAYTLDGTAAYGKATAISATADSIKISFWTSITSTTTLTTFLESMLDYGQVIYGVYLTTDGKITVDYILNDGTLQTYTGDLVINDGDYHNIIVELSSTVGMSLYIDGNLDINYTTPVFDLTDIASTTTYFGATLEVEYLATSDDLILTTEDGTLLET